MDTDPAEHVFFHGHPSWRSILSFYIRGLVIAIIAGAVAGLITRISASHVQTGWVVVVVLIAFVLVVVIGLIKRISVIYTITNRRLRIRTGILRRDYHETRLERVQNVNTSQTVVDRMLRVGTVDFDTAAGDDYEFKFRGVANPQKIVTTVDAAIHAQQQQTRREVGGV